jgi:hypothetical protein
MVVGFTTTCAISAYHHYSREQVQDSKTKDRQYNYDKRKNVEETDKICPKVKEIEE